MNYTKWNDWFDTLGILPKMIQEGRKVLGVKEIPGANSNPEILKFADEIGVKSIYKNDDTSWCAVAHNAIAKRAGKTVSYVDKYDFLRALAFEKQGTQFNIESWEVVDKVDGMLGDSMIFIRPGGGHIGEYLGETPSHFIVMGGNQSNEYSITRIAKERLHGIRRPKYSIIPPSVKKYYFDNAGIPITTNEK